MTDRDLSIANLSWIVNDIEENGNMEHAGQYLDPLKRVIKRLEKSGNAPAAKTFHVIDRKTGKIADTYKIALREKWAKSLCYCDMEGFALEEDGTLLLMDECGKFVYCDRSRFEVVWEDEDGNKH